MMASVLSLLPLIQAHSAQTSGAAAVANRPVIVASKPFAEGYLLAEIFAQQLETRGIQVTRRFGLGGTEIIFPALLKGDVDLYPEYTGTGMLVMLKRPSPEGSAAVFELVAREFASRYDLRWLPPLGFENTYAISVRTSQAQELGLRTFSDFARVSERMRAGFTADFIGLPDGLPMLRERYGLRLREVNALAPAVKYQALMNGSVDIIDAYSTDGLLGRHAVTVLEDDQRAFPPYDAAALVRGELWRTRPEVIAALAELSGRFDVVRMRRLNERVEVNREEVARVAADGLRELGLVAVTATPASAAPSAGTLPTTLTAYLWAERAAIGQRTLRHLTLVGISLLLATGIAVPLALLLERLRWAEAVLGGIGLLQTVPGIALLAFMLPVLGIGSLPAVVALFLYSLYPILRNTYTGVREADPRAVATATALGMTPGQVLRQVRLPLAAPVIMAGIRTAAVLSVGTATLAAFIGAGGLGDPIVAGLALADTRMILSGAVPAAGLALAADGLLGLVERAVAPRGMRPW
jgi:osmoprotectant transport system permease protein